MIREEDFRVALVHHAVSSSGASLLKSMWHRDAGVLARRRTGCVDHRFSRKMGRLVALHGRNTASVIAYFLDRDPTVLAWWHQPFEYEWKVRNASGKVTGAKVHQPQFVILRADGFVVLDFVDDSNLIERREAGQDYDFDPSDQSWRWRTAEREYGLLNLRYEVHSLGTIPYILHQNLRDLERYEDGGYQALSEEQRRKILDVFAREGMLSIRECVDHHEISGDLLRRALFEGLVVADLIHTHLSQPQCLIFRDPSLLDDWLESQTPAPALPLPANELIEENEVIRYRGESLVVVSIDGDDVLLRGIGADLRIVSLKELQALNGFQRKGEMTGILVPRIRNDFVNLRESERDVGLARLNWLDGKPDNRIRPPSSRTLQRWRVIADAEPTRLRKIIALGKNRKPGNRSPRRTAKHERFVRRIVRRIFDKTPSASKTAAYSVYRERLPNIGGTNAPMSMNTFNKLVDLYTDPLAKYGKREAYQRANVAGQRLFNNSPHGTLPHQVVHVDHTLVDVELIYPDGRNLGRAWLTMFWDASMKRARAIVLSFRNPNTETFLLGIREYVQRWGCIPNEVVVDGAKELKTGNVRALETAFGIEVRGRTGSEGRSGSPIESRFGSRTKEVDQQLPGSTSHLQEARRYAGKISPTDDAEWTLPALYLAYEAYFFEKLARVHKDPIWGQSPEEHEAEVIRWCGKKSFIEAHYDFDLLIMTAPLLRCQSYIVQQQGVNANCGYYTNSAIRRAKPGEKVLVRGEPHCANITYVYINDKWTIAIARDLRLFEGFTLYQAAIALQEWRRQNRRLGRDSRWSPKAIQLRNALHDATRFDPELLYLRQSEEARLRDANGQNVTLDETGKKACFGEVKPLDASRGRLTHVIPRDRRAKNLELPAERVAELPAGLPGLRPSTPEVAAEEIPQQSSGSAQAQDDSSDGAEQKKAVLRRRTPRVIGDDAWRKIGFR